MLLPGGVDEYLQRRRRARAAEEAASAPAPAASPAKSDAAAQRQRKKDLARIEGQLVRAEKEIEKLHAAMTDAASDYEQLAKLTEELQGAEARRDDLEEAWLEAAE